jgi:hypothetical protein
MEIPPSDSELYLAIAIAFISRERKESKPSFLALLERDRENPEQLLIRL